jgi:EpsI family protein
MRPGLRVVISAGVLLAALFVLQLRSTGEAVPIRKPLDAFPVAVGDWRGREATIFEVDVLNVLKVKDYLMRRYVDPSGRSLWLYIGYWDSQRKGAQPHSPRNCLPGSGWEPLEASRLTVILPSPHPALTVNRYLIQKDRDQLLVFYWYDAQGQAVADEVAAKVAMVKNSIFRNRTDGALIRITSPVYQSVAETSALVVGYVQAMYPALGEFLPR